MGNRWAIFLVFSFLLAGCSRDPADRVDVFNGTDAAGNTYPGATLPFGAVQLSPDTGVDTASGYRYSHDTILGFSHTHLSGTGCPDLGDFLVTPGLDRVEPLPFSHRDETARPGSYKVDFREKGIVAELTVTPHVGVHRYTFKGKGTRLIQVDARHCVGGWSTATEYRLTLEGSELLGYRRVTGWAHGRDVYLSAVFSEPFLEAEEVEPGKMVFIFADDLKEVTLFAGISGVDANGARANRVRESAGGWFDALRKRAMSSWDGVLDRIQVKGGPADLFYTNFYHTFLTPNRINDIDGRYRDEAGRNRSVPVDRRFYSTLSLWDTFRAWHPLETLLDTALVTDIVRSMLDDYDCRGELPVWPLASDETGCMIGYHSVSVIADAWLRGIRGYDGEKALQAMIVSSDRNKVNTSVLYNAYGYIPADMKVETVSQTLEFAYDDWCIARMAESLGHGDIATAYDARSLRYRALFDPSTGFMRGKNADGNWTEPFDPYVGSRDYTEATPWQYRFFVPHDMLGLRALMGGEKALYAALDSLFTHTQAGQETLDPGIGGILAQYAQGNEPDHNFPWLFHWAGAPSRSQEIVRKLLTETYSKAPGGLSGNEDCGQMGAWYVLASIGLYPACPGTGEYLLTAPLFRETVLRLANGNTLIIKADRPKNPYIADVTLNGEPLRQHFITYDQLMGGGELSFRLSAKPCHDRDGLPAPYSLTDGESVSLPAHKLAVNRADLRKGCHYTYHEANFRRVDQIEPDPPEAAGRMDVPSIAAAPAQDHFAYCFTGYIDIPADGLWQFSTKSDDGSALFIDGVCVLDNDGSHDPVVVEGSIPLKKGLHTYRLLYFDDEGGQELTWSWKAPGAAAYAPVPANRLFYL